MKLVDQRANKLGSISVYLEQGQVFVLDSGLVVIVSDDNDYVTALTDDERYNVGDKIDLNDDLEVHQQLVRPNLVNKMELHILA